MTEVEAAPEPDPSWGAGGDETAAGGEWGTADTPMADESGKPSALRMAVVEMPRVDLFGKWDVSEIQVRDLSLVVSVSTP